MSDVFSDVFLTGRPAMRAAADATAHELGLFAACATPISAGALESRLGLRTGRLRPLLDVLVLEGRLHRAEGGAFVAALVPPVPPLGSAWIGLADRFRMADTEDVPFSGDGLRRYHEYLLLTGAEAAREVADVLAPWIADGTLLDLGAGAGTYTRALLETAPNARAVLVDRSEVLMLAREALGPLAARASFLSGELADVSFGEGHRVVLLANLLHLLGPSASERLVARAVEALAPGGLLVVKDFAVEPDRSGPPEGLYFALNMVAFTRDGDVHDPVAIAAWLRAAGLRDVSVSGLASSPATLLVTGVK